MSQLQKELNELLLAKRAETRPKVRKHNIDVGLLNERIAWLRGEIKRVSRTQCDDGYPSCRNAEATGMWCEGICAAKTSPLPKTPSAESG